MATPNPPGFDPQGFIDGIHLAMTLGAPNAPADQATFYWIESRDTGGNAVDEQDVPFDPVKRTTTKKVSAKATCAIEYTDGADRTERFGTRQASRITVTLLQPDWEPVSEFEFVVWGGDKYLRRSHQVDALGSVDVHTVQCVAEDET